MSSQPSVRFPEVGDLVRIRQRRWVVTSVRPSPFAKFADDQHLLELVSIEEDAQAETLSVVWEVEPDARVEAPELPQVSGFDDFPAFENFLNAVRWGGISNISGQIIQSPYRSGITIEDYQLEPVVRAVNMANVSLMIADDVGLGKTIEAGLVVQEMLLRYRARTVLIVCPASLQLKWREEMLSKFGLEFKIVDTEYLKGLRRRRGMTANPWTSYPRLITSMDWAKTGDGLDFMQQALPSEPTYPRKFDILIVDEAHSVAPRPGEEGDSQRTRFIRLVSPHFAHHMFLSATPHNGRRESWLGLLELLDSQRFNRLSSPSPEQLALVLVRRLKKDIRDAEGNCVFPKRELHKLLVNYTDEERHVHELLQRYSKARTAAAEKSLNSKASLGVRFVLQTLKKRLFSSPRAFAQTLDQHLATLRRMERGEFNQESARVAMSRLEASVREAEEALEKPDAETLSPNGEMLIEDFDGNAVELSTRVCFTVPDEEKRILNELHRWAEKMRSNADSKLTAVIKWIRENLIKDGKWTNRRVILFTEYVSTLSVLQELLSGVEVGDGTLADPDRLMCIDGSTDTETREAIKAAFQANPEESPVRILLATDAASEGIDLQNWCSDLIHLEIPWNPNVMEQRNGRIDRHGQKSSVVNIWHPVGADVEADIDGLRGSVRSLDADAQYLYQTAWKINQIGSDLGSVSDVIAEDVKSIMLGIALAKGLTHEAEERRIAVVRKRLQVSMNETTKKLHERIVRAREELHLDPDVIRQAVEAALKLAGQPPLVTLNDPEGESVEVGEDAGKLFMLPPLSGAWAVAHRNIADPYTHMPRPVTFDHEVARRRGQSVVLLHLNHPLVAMSLRLLREEVWAPEGRKSLHRVAVRVVPDEGFAGIGALVVSRLLVSGSDGTRLHEEVTFAGGVMKSSTFERERKIETLRAWFAAGRPASASEIPDRIKDVIRNRFEQFRTKLQTAVDVRGEDRRQSLLKQLDDRCQQEQKMAEKALQSLAETLRQKLNGTATEDAEEIRQERLFSDEDLMDGLTMGEKAELKERLESIPHEIEAARELIRSRYVVSEDDVRNLPVGMIFLVPERLMA